MLAMNRLAISPQTRSRAVGEEQRPRLQAVLLEAGEHDRSRRGGRQAERQERHQRAGGGGIVRRFGPGDAFDRALAELLRLLREPLLQRVGEERRDLGAARRHRAHREAEQRAAQPWLPRAPPVLERSSRASRAPARSSPRRARLPRRPTASRRRRRAPPRASSPRCRRGDRECRRSGAPGRSAGRCRRARASAR